jgi:4'-phosphopantetheinyl transferase EntD
MSHTRAIAEIEALVRAALPHGIGIGVRLASQHTALPPLHPLEEQYLGPNATARRRVMFSLGRAAARDALSHLDITDHVAIGRGPGGEPVWPTGVVGAISHSGDVAVAVVGRAANYAGLGVDVERRSPGLSERGARLVCRPAEIDWALGDGGGLRRTMLFSAKEVIFKALYPIERVWLGFGDAELTWDPARCLFVARVLKAVGAGFEAGLQLEVRSAATPHEVVSTTFLRRPPARSPATSG